MSSPDQGKPASSQSSTQAAPVAVRQPVERDLIPIPLLVGIFAVIMAITWFVLHDNWATDMTRYRSIKAQQKGDWKTAAQLIESLRDVGRKKGDAFMEFSPTYLSELGRTYLGMGDLNKSLEFYKLAQQHRANVPPDDSGGSRPPIDFNAMIGYVYYKMGNLDEAEKALQEALKFDKLDPRANFTMGEVAMKRGNYTKAADYFKVVAKNPDYEQLVRKYYAQIEEKLFAGIK